MGGGEEALTCRLAASAALWTTDAKSPDCVIAPEQVQVSRSPPGEVSLIALLFSDLYLPTGGDEEGRGVSR